MNLPAPLPRLNRADAFPLLLRLGGLGFALIVGLLVVRQPALGLAAAAAVLFTPIAFVDLPLALALWTGTLFLRLIPGIGLGTSMAGLLLIAAWLGTTGRGVAAVRVAFARLSIVGPAALLLLLWLGITLAWATDHASAQSELLYWAFALLLMIIVTTTLDTAGRLRLVAGAFVAGAVASVLSAVISGDLTTDPSAVQTASEGRFSAAGADPNDLAAGLVPAVALALGLLAGVRGPRRVLCIAAAVVLAAGIAATQSRGGLVATAAAILAAIAVARGRRLAATTLAGGAALVAAFMLALTPGALERVTNTDNGGNGREDLWTIAGRMAADHPVTGVGLNQFREQSEEYVRDPGTLEYVTLIVESPHVVHNTYLQLLAETGAIGLGLYLVLVLLVLSTTWRAARLFGARGSPAMEVLAQATFVAQVGILAASTFLSIGNDFRTWLLLGFGPALFAIAQSPSTMQLDRRDER